MKDIPGYEGLYAIEEDGRVWSYKRKIYLKQSTTKDGYYKVGLRKNNITNSKRVHRLIAETYIPNPNNYPTVDHIDRNKSNNTLENLRWASLSLQNTNKDNTKNIERAKNGIANPLVPVKRIDKNNNEKIYKSVADGAVDTVGYEQKENGVKGICAVCRGKNKTYKGYRWEYVTPTE